ncbi:MAG: hypothetical protein EOO59_03335 [Hymenobacter sp.]|nr:MAG: hypothetical protein EOO59_03335 [Hymenobacter sp.]
MKTLLRLILLLPLPAFAQFGRSYTGPTMQQNQQSRQDFNRMTNQRTQDFQQRLLLRGRSGQGGLSMREASLQAHAKQQKLEQEATESLARLSQQQQRQRQEHPAPNPQQAAAQQKADDKQLTLLAVKNYRDVFLPGQLSSALEAQSFSPSAAQSMRSLNQNLLDDAWWSKQAGAQAPANVKAYGDSLRSLTAGLLGFSLAAPPAKPAAFSANGLREQLTKDTFDQSAATQLLREAALSDRLSALHSDNLPKAVQEFSDLATALPSDPKKLRKEVQKSLREVNKQLARYQLRLAAANQVYLAEKALRKTTSTYLAKNTK